MPSADWSRWQRVASAVCSEASAFSSSSTRLRKDRINIRLRRQLRKRRATHPLLGPRVFCFTSYLLSTEKRRISTHRALYPAFLEKMAQQCQIERKHSPRQSDALALIAAARTVRLEASHFDLLAAVACGGAQLSALDRRRRGRGRLLVVGAVDRGARRHQGSWGKWGGESARENKFLFRQKLKARVFDFFAHAEIIFLAFSSTLYL